MRIWEMTSESYPAIPVAYTKRVYEEIKRITRIPFPMKRSQEGKPFQAEFGGYRFSVSILGILILESTGNDPIPGFDQVVALLKRSFSNVYAKGGNYINARGYGKSWKENKTSFSAPKSKAPLPKMVPPAKGTKSDVERFIHLLRTILASREVRAEGNTPVKVVAHDGLTRKVLEQDGKYYLHEVASYYWLRGLDEVREFGKILDLYHNVMRQLEVASWSEPSDDARHMAQLMKDKDLRRHYNK